MAPERQHLKHITGAPVSGNLRERQLVFVHVPKTAGTTLDRVLGAYVRMQGTVRLRATGTIYGQNFERNIPEAMDNLADFRKHELQAASIVSGHFPFNDRTVSSVAESAAFITVLREPVARAVSHFLFNAERGLWAKESDLPDLRRAGLLIDNMQVRQLAGCTDPAETCDEKMLKQAMTNLDRHFAAVGRADRFDEFLGSLVSLCGWPDIIYSNFQVAKTEIEDSRLSSLRAQIKTMNEMDLCLFDKVKRQGNVWLNKIGEGPAPKRDDTVLVASPLVRPKGQSVVAFPKSQLPDFVQLLNKSDLNLTRAGSVR